MEIVSPQIIVRAYQQMYTVCSIMGKESIECKQTTQKYATLARKSCLGCKHYSIDRCKRISNYNLLTKKDVSESMQFYFRICGGYFYEAASHVPPPEEDATEPEQDSL